MLIICPFCGAAHLEAASECRRCESKLPESRCKTCKISVDWGLTYCDRCTPDVDPNVDSCPACGVLNDPEADYCARCGSPMAVITRVVRTSDGADKLDPWRVYGVETTLVGRDAELAILHQTLDEVEAKNSLRLALIRGAEGLGKSRLLAEFERRLESSFCKAVILRGVCREEVSGAFAVIARMLRAHFYIPDTASPEMARRSLADAVTSLLGNDQKHLIRQLGELMGLPFPGERETSQNIAPRQREISVFKAVETILRVDATSNPLLFILDDVHLAPDTTLRLLTHLIESLKDAPIFFVFSQLTGARRVIPPRTAQVELDLAPLSDLEVRHHVTDTLRLASTIPEPLIESVIDASLGNPLIVEEILRIFIAEGIIDTRSEPWQIDGDRLQEIEVPTTVEATVEARIDGLSEAERQTLEMAACVGNLFWSELLRCLDGLRLHAADELNTPWLLDSSTPDHYIDDVIESLERKDIIRRQLESRLPRREEFIFKHRLEREALYKKLPTSARQRYHRFIAQWMEREPVEETDGAAEFIARHYARAHCLRRAAKKYLQAGDDARRHHANRKAIELYVEALGCLTDADMDLKMRAFHDLGSVHELLGEHDQAQTYYRDMARYAWLLGDRAKGGAALNKIGRALRAVGAYDDALAYLERALGLFRDADDEPGVASTLDDIGKIYWIRGDQKTAFEYYSAALSMRRSLQNQRSIALSLSHLGTLRLQRGELREAMVFFREALDLRKGLDNRQELADSYNDLGGLCAEQGKYEKALLLFEEALDIAVETGFLGLEAALRNNLGQCLLALKRREESRVYLVRALEICTQIGEQRVLFDVLRNLAHLATKEADRSAALERSAEALLIADELDSRTFQALGELTRAEIHAEYIFDPALQDESILEANASFLRAIELLHETGNDVQKAHALAAFGHFLIESSNLDQGRLRLEQSAQIFDKLGMAKYLDEINQILDSVASPPV